MCYNQVLATFHREDANIQELNAQCQSEHSAPGPTAARLTHSRNRRLWILGQASTSFWGSAPSRSSDLLSATEAQDTDSSVLPGVSEEEVTAWPLRGSHTACGDCGRERSAGAVSPEQPEPAAHTRHIQTRPPGVTAGRRVTGMAWEIRRTGRLSALPRGASPPLI